MYDDCLKEKNTTKHDERCFVLNFVVMHTTVCRRKNPCRKKKKTHSIAKISNWRTTTIKLKKATKKKK